VTIIMAVSENIRARRKALNLTQTELARRTGLSRQALTAIEAGIYQPTVGVALSLARELGETVERLFGPDADDHAQHLEAHCYDEFPTPKSITGTWTALGRVGGKVVAIPHKPAALSLTPSAGILAGLKANRANVMTYNSPAEIDGSLLIAGCDPSATLMGDWMMRHHSPARLVSVPCSSSRALDALTKGFSHTAGVHLKDGGSDDYNLQSVRRALGRRAALVVTFARWEIGLAVAANNPLGINSVADLADRRVRLANREKGAGARAVLDAGLKQAGIRAEQVDGYESRLDGHLEVAHAIARDQADAGVTLRVAAQVYGLDFLPLREERYDLVILAAEADTVPVRAMLDALNSSRFAREINRFCGYDTHPMGQVVARLSGEASPG
jgi:putative molybdopterin biosynthesis protein